MHNKLTVCIGLTSLKENKNTILARPSTVCRNFIKNFCTRASTSRKAMMFYNSIRPHTLFNGRNSS